MRFFVLLFTLLGGIKIGLYSQSLIQWQNTIDAEGSDKLSVMYQTLDRGYICAGTSASNASLDKTEDSNGDGDFWIVKLDSVGELEWQNTIGGSLVENLYTADETMDKGHILGGRSYSSISGDKTEDSKGKSDYWVVKLDSNGVIDWQKTIGGSSWDELKSIHQTYDGGYICGGISSSGVSGDKTESLKGVYDYWILKLDPIGNIEWQKTIGGNDFDQLTSIKQTFDKGYVVGGYSPSDASYDKTESSLGNDDYWILKLDSVGSIEWQNTIGGNSWDELNEVIQSSDGGYLLAGTSYSNATGDKTEDTFGNADYWVIKLDLNGQILWQNTIGGGSTDQLYSIQETNNGEILIGGTSYSNMSGEKTEDNHGSNDYWILMLNSIGEVQWQKTIGGAYSDHLYTVVESNDGGYVLAGYSDSDISGDKTEDSESHAYWIVKLISDITTGENIQMSNVFNNVSVYPNPFTQQATLVVEDEHLNDFIFKIYDSIGRVVRTSRYRGIDEVIIERDALKEGMYYFEIIDKDKVFYSGKFQIY